MRWSLARNISSLLSKFYNEGPPRYTVAEKDNWIVYGIAALILGALAFFGIGKQVNITAGQAKADCGCGA